jgi:hypothetical protein
MPLIFNTLCREIKQGKKYFQAKRVNLFKPEINSIFKVLFIFVAEIPGLLHPRLMNDHSKLQCLSMASLSSLV